MCDSNFSKLKRFLAGTMGLMLLMAALFFTFYLAAELDHDCSQEDCPVCACIHQCECTIHQISDDTIVSIAVIVPVIITLFLAFSFVLKCPQETLVSKKVRLDN